MRGTYIRYKLYRMKAFLVREKVDFKKEFRNLEFARMLSWSSGVFLILGGIDALFKGKPPLGWFYGSIIVFGIYLLLSAYRDYKRGDDIAWQREQRRRRLYEQ